MALGSTSTTISYKQLYQSSSDSSLFVYSDSNNRSKITSFYIVYLGTGNNTDTYSIAITDTSTSIKYYVLQDIDASDISNDAGDSIITQLLSIILNTNNSLALEINGQTPDPDMYVFTVFGYTI